MDAEEYLDQGFNHLSKSEIRKAIDAFNKSLFLKKSWLAYRGLGYALLSNAPYEMVNHSQCKSAINALNNSLSLKKDGVTYHLLGRAFLRIQQYQLSIDALKKSLALIDEWETYELLGEALSRLGKNMHSTRVGLIYYRKEENAPRIKIDTYLGCDEDVNISRHLIASIDEDLSGIKYAFHPSYSYQDASEVQLKTWRHLIHIHIQKCAGENFCRPLIELARCLKASPQNKKTFFDNTDDINKVEYLWNEFDKGKITHKSFISAVFQGKNLNDIQGSFLSSHSSPFGPYDKKLFEHGISTRKICLLRDPSERLYSHLRFIARTLNKREQLVGMAEFERISNLIDRYIYDYDLFRECDESSYCRPNDYKKCESIEFFDISDVKSISKVKSSFLSANRMPNIVQYDRLHDNKDAEKYVGALQKEDIDDVYNELLGRGYLSRDDLIDAGYLKQRTAKRLIFPDVISTGVSLHPITFVYPKIGKPKLILTKDFISDPFGSIHRLLPLQ